MGMLGDFFRRVFAKPEQAPQALLQRLEILEQRLAVLHRLSGIELSMDCARELRELLAEPRYAEPGRLERHGGKVWSQNDEDGILHEIFRRIGIASRTFVEFGVSDGRECNTLRLLVEGWRGLWMESGTQECEAIRRIFAAPLADGRLELQQVSVTVENVDLLIAGSQASAAGELDLLSIDIDGNDYHVMQAVESVRPRVIVIEYNAKFPPPMDLVLPYDPGFSWDGSDYAGASLQALANLAARRGYRLVGTNITGTNAFFVRTDLAGSQFAAGDAAALYNPARYWLTHGYIAGHLPGERFDYASDAALESALRKK
jgi:hypothetical protein